MKKSNAVERIWGYHGFKSFLRSNTKMVLKKVSYAHSTFLFTSPFGLKKLGLGFVKMVRKAYY